MLASYFFVAYSDAQLSIVRSGTLSNSGKLLLTNTELILRACEAINKSLLPIGALCFFEEYSYETIVFGSIITKWFYNYFLSKKIKLFPAGFLVGVLAIFNSIAQLSVM